MCTRACEKVSDYFQFWPKRHNFIFVLLYVKTRFRHRRGLMAVRNKKASVFRWRGCEITWRVPLKNISMNSDPRERRRDLGRDTLRPERCKLTRLLTRLKSFPSRLALGTYPACAAGEIVPTRVRCTLKTHTSSLIVPHLRGSGKSTRRRYVLFSGQ